MKKVTKQEFSQIKRWLIVYRGIGGLKRVARRSRRSVKTITQIKFSKTYADYQEQNKAQHPEAGFSLAEEIFTLHRLIFNEDDGKYVRPRSAKNAIAHLIATTRKGLNE